MFLAARTPNTNSPNKIGAARPENRAIGAPFQGSPFDVIDSRGVTPGSNELPLWGVQYVFSAPHAKRKHAGARALGFGHS